MSTSVRFKVRGYKYGVTVKVIHRRRPTEKYSCRYSIS